MRLPYFIRLRRSQSAWGYAPALVFSGTVILAYGCSFCEHAIRLDSSRGAACLGLGIAFALLGLMDFVSVCTESGAVGKLLYFGTQSALLAGILWTGRLHGELALCVYPLLGATIGLLPAAAATCGSAILYGLVLAIEDHFYGLPAAERWAVGMLPGFGFVFMFTLLAVKANAARARAEALSAEVERLAVVRERNRVAREIHDTLGHYLTTLHVQLQGAETIHAADPHRALTAVAQARELAREALLEVRQSVEMLKAGAAPLPIEARLNALAAAAGGWGAAVAVEILGTPRRLSAASEHALVRCAQEGLTNMRKHARAQRATVRLDYRDRDRLRLDVTDDGRGAATIASGNGLSGVRERIEALGGRVRAENAAGGGFRLQVEIPT
ncbi:MAG: sensor histidine kinase [Opitutaceae bacterium]